MLLSSSSQYALNELPADKASRLVFYCANPRCGASHQAALRAHRGWLHRRQAAGLPTTKPTS